MASPIRLSERVHAHAKITLFDLRPLRRYPKWEQFRSAFARIIRITSSLGELRTAHRLRPLPGLEDIAGWGGALSFALVLSHREDGLPLGVLQASSVAKQGYGRTANPLTQSSRVDTQAK